MKKIIFFLMAMFAIVSCTNHDMWISYEEAKAAEYDAAFAKKYGTIDPNHDWGFGTVVTRSAYPNSNQWEDEGYVIPAEITAEEIAKVKAVFDQKGEESYESLVDWDCFFVQQVWKGTASYTAGNGSTVVGGDQMDWLCAYDPVGHEETIYPDWNGWQATVVTNNDDHVNNFNNAAGSIMLMINSSTQRFGYKSSTDNGHVFYYFRMEYIDGAYYVGFDFSAEGQNPNEQVQRDYIYNDWIVKIVPGKGQSTGGNETQEIKYAKRIICEDLGAIGDFDFNDVVFDALIKDGKTYIKLLAAGGTMELTVAGHEVHEEFKVPVTTMVNTGLHSCDEVEFVVDDDFGGDYAAIPVIVKVTTPAGELTSMELKNGIGHAPKKIAVGTDYVWTAEYQPIDNKYEGFKSYVGNYSLSDSWYK